MVASGQPLPNTGDVIAGKYRVERVLGVGGMGVVVAAHHIQLEEKVALKFLLPAAVASAEVLQRFIREARAAAKIKSEHVARVSDVGTLENGAPYMVMEYLDGSDLAVWLAKNGPLPVDLAVDFVLQACEALAEAHTLGIVHRDLKPANLFCVHKADGTLSIKVLDFGISKLTRQDGSSSEMTKTTAFLGSPLYMSPEQMQVSKGVDARTDIWSLGVILFELLSGRPPFDGSAVTELIVNIATVPAPPVRTLRIDVPSPLDAAITTCLAKDRTQRFQTVGDLALAIQGFGTARARTSTEGILGTLRRAGAFPPAELPMPGGAMSSPSAAGSIHGGPGLPVTAQTSAAWGQTGAPPQRSGRLMAAVAIFATLSVLGAVAAFAFHRPTKPSPAAPAAASSETRTPEPQIPQTAQTAAATTAPPPVVPAASVPPPTAPASASTPRSAVTAQTASARATSAPAAQAMLPTPHPAAAPVAAPAAPPPVAPAAGSCTPNYYFDDKGQKHFKPECFSH